MPKKAKKDNKKKSKVKKIPAKAGAKARVSKDGKVEVILPVDRSRGPYKPRKTEEQKIQERLQELRAQERRQYSRDVLAPESISGSYRRGGSIYRSDVQAPTGGFTNLSSVKEQKDNTRLQAVEKKLDKLIEKKQEPKKVEPEPAPAPKPKPIIEEVSTRPLATRRRQATATPLTGQTVRPQPSGGIVSDIAGGVSALATAGLSAGVGLATAGVSGLIEANRERQRDADIKRRQEEQERKEKERKQAITDSTQARLKKVDERLKTGSGIADSIMGGERKKIITLRAEPNPERERRELDRRRKALQEEKNTKDKEEAFKERERIRREEQQLKLQEKEKAKKDAEDIFSELETAKKVSSYIQPQPRTNIPVATPLIPEATEQSDEDDFETGQDTDSDDEFQSAEELEEDPSPPPRKPKAPELPPRDEPPALPPRDNDAEQKRKQVLQDQEIARDLLREEARNKDRKLKEAQERANELDKLNRDFIAHKNREDRNARRQEQRRKDKEAKTLLDEVIGEAVKKKEVEEEVEKIVLGGATAGLIERAPVSANRGRKIDTSKLIDAGATRQEIEDYEQDNKQRKRLVDGIYSAFGINLTGTGDGLDYVKSGTSKDKRLQIRRDTIKKLRERGLLVNQIQEFTRTLDQIDELIKRRDDFGNRFQRRGGAVELRRGGGRGRAGRPRGRGRGRGQRVPQQVADIEERERQERD